MSLKSFATQFVELCRQGKNFGVMRTMCARNVVLHRWRSITSTAVASAFSLFLLPSSSYGQAVKASDVRTHASTVAEDTSIRPFHINVPEKALADLRQRIAATRWPDKETVNDESQGIRLAEMQALVQHWGNGYNWRNVEAKLNALPEFVTTIDGVDIQFIHVHSREPNALPLILTHGWPGSPLEFLKVIGPLTDPVAYGGRTQDVFDVVIPAIPGYGFSGKPTDLGWNPDRVARAWDVLMKRLGYTRYVSQGGDHGSVISDALARQAPPGLLGIHLTMPATIPPNLVNGINSGEPAPTGLTAPELWAYNTLSTFFRRNAAYGAMMVTRPQTIGYALADWPALYFVDAKGHIRHHYFGEGEYEKSERIIQQLLAEAGITGIDPKPVSVDAQGGKLPPICPA